MKLLHPQFGISLESITEERNKALRIVPGCKRTTQRHLLFPLVCRLLSGSQAKVSNFQLHVFIDEKITCSRKKMLQFWISDIKTISFHHISEAITSLTFLKLKFWIQVSNPIYREIRWYCCLLEGTFKLGFSELCIPRGAHVNLQQNHYNSKAIPPPSFKRLRYFIN